MHLTHTWSNLRNQTVRLYRFCGIARITSPANIAEGVEHWKKHCNGGVTKRNIREEQTRIASRCACE